MQEVILLLYKILIWTPVFPNVRIARHGDIPLLHVIPKVHVVLNVMNFTRINIITTLLGVVK